MMNEYEGYSLFIDVDDYKLAQNNRMKVLVKMIEGNLTDEGMLSTQGIDIIVGYVRSFDGMVQDNLLTKLTKELKRRNLL